MFEEFKEAFRNSKDLYAFLEAEEEFPDEVYPVLLPKRLASRIKKAGKSSPLWRQFVPDPAEWKNDHSGGLYDPIGDAIHSKGDGIIHRYKNRLLFSPLTICPVNCRYCFRKSELSDQDAILKGNLSKLSEYLRENPQVEEVILTGGDPFMLGNKKLSKVLEELQGKVKYVRFHTRLPVIIPERIDADFIEIIRAACKKFTALHIAIHANHMEEFDQEAERAIRRLKEAGARLLSQSVLLKGVNDSVEDLKNLYTSFAKLEVQSYYLHHPDKVKGAMHFYMSLEEGRRLYARLRDELPGWAIPHYILDPENGQGKNLAYNSESISFSGRFLDRFNNSKPLLR